MNGNRIKLTPRAQAVALLDTKHRGNRSIPDVSDSGIISVDIQPRVVSLADSHQDWLLLFTELYASLEWESTNCKFTAEVDMHQGIQLSFPATHVLATATYNVPDNGQNLTEPPTLDVQAMWGLGNRPGSIAPPTRSYLPNFNAGQGLSLVSDVIKMPPFRRQVFITTINAAKAFTAVITQLQSVNPASVVQTDTVAPRDLVRVNARATHLQVTYTGGEGAPTGVMVVFDLML